jgi:hypothetical protein
LNIEINRGKKKQTIPIPTAAPAFLKGWVRATNCTSNWIAGLTSYFKSESEFIYP